MNALPRGSVTAFRPSHRRRIRRRCIAPRAPIHPPSSRCGQQAWACRWLNRVPDIPFPFDLVGRGARRPAGTCKGISSFFGISGGNAWPSSLWNPTVSAAHACSPNLGRRRENEPVLNRHDPRTCRTTHHRRRKRVAGLWPRQPTAGRGCLRSRTPERAPCRGTVAAPVRGIASPGR